MTKPRLDETLKDFIEHYGKYYIFGLGKLRKDNAIMHNFECYCGEKVFAEDEQEFIQRTLKHIILKHFK